MFKEVENVKNGASQFRLYVRDNIIYGGAGGGLNYD